MALPAVRDTASRHPALPVLPPGEARLIASDGIFRGKFGVESAQAPSSARASIHGRLVQIVLALVLLLSRFTFGFSAPLDRITAGAPEGVHYRNAAPGVSYVGSAQCSTCHRSIYESFRKTSMGRSMAPADTPADLMRVPLPVTVFDGRSNLYFTVYRQSSSLYQAEFRVDSHGKELFRHVEKLVYSIGAGAVGYTYMVQRGQYLFEAPLSFYSKRETWDLSPGYNLQDPGFSRPIVTLCIECHGGRPLPASPRASPGALFVSFKGADPPLRNSRSVARTATVQASCTWKSA